MGTPHGTSNYHTCKLQYHKCFRSVCLLIQAALPCVCFACGETEILLRGGTNADMAPQIDYFDRVRNALAVIHLLQPYSKGTLPLNDVPSEIV